MLKLQKLKGHQGNHWRQSVQTTCMLMRAGLKVWDEIKNNFIMKKALIYLRLFAAQHTIVLTTYYLHHLAVCSMYTVPSMQICFVHRRLHTTSTWTVFCIPQCNAFKCDKVIAAMVLPLVTLSFHFIWQSFSNKMHDLEYNKQTK